MLILDSTKFMRKRIINLLATFFYVGYLPFFPGTWASFVTLFVGYYYLNGESFLNYIYLIYFVLIIGIWSATEYDKIYKTHDCKHIVIDEVVGQLIALTPIFFYNKHGIIFYLIGFILFRFFDISKIFGIKELQKWPKGVGVVADDFLAGVYSALILWSLLWKIIG